MSNVSTRFSENRLSDNSQVLYMATPRADTHRGRSSSVSASNVEIEPCAVSAEVRIAEVAAAETRAWGMIEQEISEWQYTCKSGRPYCWSREARRKRSYSEHRFPDFSDNSFWSGDGSEDTPDEQTETFSESHSKVTANLNATAEMVALQLLGSCFTLPSYHAQMASKHMPRRAHSESPIPDPRLISSLRLHSQFRYSPSFGHQAPNPSPIQFGPGNYDGTPPPPSAGLETDPAEYSIHEFSRRKGRNSRALNNSEVSNSSFSTDGGHHISRCNTIDPDVNAVTKAWYRRNSIREAVSRSLTMPALISGSARAERLDASLDDESYCSTHAGAVLTKKRPLSSGFRLQPVLRSEPHPVFVQPVKELVVKRWRRFRRKVSGAHHSHSAPGSPCGHISEASESGRSTISDDGRLRRRRAQERGDIHSSLESSPRCTTPASGCSPAEKEKRLPRPYWEECEERSSRSKHGTNTLCGSEEGSAHHNTPCSVYSTPDGRQRVSWLASAESSPRQELSDSLATEAAAALVVDNKTTHARVHTDAATASTPLQPPSTPVMNYSPGYPSTPGPRASPPTSSSPKSHSGGETPNTAEFQLRTMQLIPAFRPSSMRIPRDRRRKSCLSEVCTAQEFRQVPNTDSIADTEERNVDRDVSSAVESAHETPLEKGPQPIYLSNDPADPIPTTPPAKPRRPNLFRMSSSGTQVFTPSSDGVEVDGMPVGPSNDMWSGSGERRERSYL
jgi:hypothetical protein